MKARNKKGVLSYNDNSAVIPKGGEMMKSAVNPASQESELSACNLPSKGGSRCDCCPYGYHIDLDFVRYCEAVYNGTYLQKLKQLKRDRRKQRKCMELYVDQLESYTTSTENKSHQMPILLMTQGCQTSEPPPDLLSTSDSLQDAVLDFEETLLSTRSSKSTTPSLLEISYPSSADHSAPVDLLRNAHQVPLFCSDSGSSNADSAPSSCHLSPNNPRHPVMDPVHGVSGGDDAFYLDAVRNRCDSMSSISSHSTASSVSIHLPAYSDQNAPNYPTPERTSRCEDASSSASLGIHRNMLTNIREQMATSLRRMRELEEQVKTIPILQVKLSVLKEEKRLLLLQLKAKSKMFDQRSVGVGEQDMKSSVELEADVRKDEFKSEAVPTIMASTLTPKSHSKSWVKEESREERIRTLEKVTGMKSVGVICSVLTREVGVGHVTEKSKSVAVGSDTVLPTLEESRCTSCNRKMKCPSSESSSSVFESESDDENEATQRKMPFQSPCSKCLEKESKVMVDQCTNTIEEPRTVGKFEQLTLDVLEQTSIAPQPQHCSKCSEREKLRFHNVGVSCRTHLFDRAVSTDKLKLISRGTESHAWPVRATSMQTETRNRDTSTSTDVVRKRDATCQVIGLEASKKVCPRCDGKRTRDFGVGNRRIHDLACERCSNLKTRSVGSGDYMVNEPFCERCMLLQMETTGVGDDNVFEVKCDRCSNLEQVDVAVGTDKPQGQHSVGVNTMVEMSRTGSFGVKVCDKCHATIESVAKDFVESNNGMAMSKSSVHGKSGIIQSLQQIGSAAKSEVISSITQSSSTRVVSCTSSTLTVESSWSDSDSFIGTSFRNPHAELCNVESSPSKTSIDSGLPSRVVGSQTKSGSECESDTSESESSNDSPDEGSYDGVFGRIINECTDDLAIKQGLPGAVMFQPYQLAPREKVKLSKETHAACKVLNDHLSRPDRGTQKTLNSSISIIQQDWFRVASQKNADARIVEDYLDAFEEFSKALLNYIVNLTDSSGNTVLHYAVSFGNFDVVSVLLDSKVCDVSKPNKAGYSCVMLVSLAKICNETHGRVVQRLFQLGDVNTKATQNGQTALMLAASQGHVETAKLLLEAGAEVNLQDNDGSTALMCAAEHGHMDVVKLLLAHPDCDPSICDNDNSTALSIAMEAGFRDVGLVIYGRMNFSRGSSPYASLKGRKRSGKPSGLRTSPAQTPPPPSPARSRHSSISTSSEQSLQSEKFK